jgi:hypothetical protein
MSDQSDILRPHRCDHAGDATADDLFIPHSEYLDEIQAALGRTEQAYQSGDYPRAAELAFEGLETIRVSVPKLGAQNIPGHYAAFFHCFRMHDEFQQALRLYKQGIATRNGRRGRVDRAALERARALLEPKVAKIDDKLQVERLVFEFPVAGRLLRGVARLREKLREELGRPAG